MTPIWLLIILALTAAIVLRDHRARDLEAQRDDLAEENDDLRGDLRVMRAELAHARRTIAAVVLHAEKRAEVKAADQLARKRASKRTAGKKAVRNG